MVYSHYSNSALVANRYSDRDKSMHHDEDLMNVTSTTQI